MPILSQVRSYHNKIQARFMTAWNPPQRPISADNLEIAASDAHCHHALVTHDYDAHHGCHLTRFAAWRSVVTVLFRAGMWRASISSPCPEQATYELSAPFRFFPHTCRLTRTSRGRTASPGQRARWRVHQGDPEAKSTSFKTKGNPMSMPIGPSGSSRSNSGASLKRHSGVEKMRGRSVDFTKIAAMIATTTM